jgi:tetratricopeptide (TPR) repeat protein
MDDGTSTSAILHAHLARRSAALARFKPMPHQMSQQGQQSQMLAPRPPLVAYRDDLARRGSREPFGPSDSTWISLATILSHAVDVPPESRPPLFQTLHDVIVGDPTLRHILDGIAEQPEDAFELDSVSPIVRAVVERMEDDGAFNLAYSTLTILANADLRPSAIERGRVLAQLGRVAWKAGALDTSRDHYRRTEVLGRTASSPELRVRAWVGYSILARLRGNYPEVRKWATRAAHEADRAGLTKLASLAYHSLMIAAAITGDLNAALVYGWRSFQGAEGDPNAEASMLLNLSQMLYESGHSEVAINGFAAALAREPVARTALPILGGMALAAAKLGDAPRVRSTKSHALRLIASSGMPYEAAAVLLELAQALALIGDTGDAEERRQQGLQIAKGKGYHELTHRLETLRIKSRTAQRDLPYELSPHAEAVVRAVASLTVGAGE